MLKNLRQIVPSAACLNCDVCCRYPERSTSYAPSFFLEEAKGIENKLSVIGDKIDLKTPPLPYKDFYICPFFTPAKNSCQIYSERPFDCQLYPFMVTYDNDYRSIVLTLDEKCPYFGDKLDPKDLKEYIDYVVDILEDKGVVEAINKNKIFINDFQEDSIILRRLENLSRKISFYGLGLRRISLGDKELFDKYFSKINSDLSSCHFGAIYIWSGILNILWKEIEGALCIFAGNERDYFLLAPPIDGGFTKDAIKESLEVLSELNNKKAKAVRIENIPQDFINELTSCGFAPKKTTSSEYIYERMELAELKGDKFKSKRAPLNNFIKNYNYKYRALEKKDIFDCLALYKEWASQKSVSKKDNYFRALIEDSYSAQKIALMNFESLGLWGRVVEVDGKIKGYTIGYPLNKDIFVILFETTDLDIQGLSQFIFREFCRELVDYKYINALSDSDLENLKRVKESYHPIKKTPVFTAYL